MNSKSLMHKSLFGFIAATSIAVNAAELPISFITDSGLITGLTGNEITIEVLSFAFDQGLPLAIGLLSDSPLTPLVESGAPLLIDSLEPVLSAPYNLHLVSDSLDGVVLPGL
ncbi:hypothetical protein [Zhongshania aquimaris]|uniref:Uncharacterized protein n=1 Tax=Zhongshania aquimaris TaxID=2857107 RepID=A0ABS6VV06_9GAMM|nr:hypothetical protein [Zhongshania aquimaris]MBW2942171.1 hypothetical protein [Zhongshania aquimaris]